MYNNSFAPRFISTNPLDDAVLAGGVAFEFNSMASGRIRPRTCNMGFTKYCDSDGQGGTCTYGWTFKCDRRGPVRK